MVSLYCKFLKPWAAGIVCIFQNVCYMKFQILEHFSDYTIVGAVQKMRANTASPFRPSIASWNHRDILD